MLATMSEAPTQLSGWGRRAVLAALAALAAVGALLAARRLAGAFDAALPASQLIAVAAIVGVVSVGSRLLWRQLKDPLADADWRRLDLVVGFGGTLAIVLTAIGCSYPAGRPAPWVLWLTLLIADLASAHLYFKGARRAPRSAAERDWKPAANNERVLQELVRLRDAAGAEFVRGTLRADFIPGQRHATLHVGFCPPLASLPEVAAEPTEGPDATVKVVQAFAHGVRLEVRLADPADSACHALIALSAAPAAPMVPSSRAPI